MGLLGIVLAVSLGAILSVDASNQVIPPTCEEIRSMKIAINHLYGPNGDMENLHALVRLAFHSCVGGCDGCINLNHGANMGLQGIIGLLEEKYQKLNLTVSRADFWAFAGQLAIEKAASLHTETEMKKPCFDYQWGRLDCATSPTTDAEFEFPEGHLTGQQMFSYFTRLFNFNENEVVAILGAHSIGQAVPENSGYNGVWIPGEIDIFNNHYYEDMLDPTLNWENKDAAAGKNDTLPHWQWEAVDPEDNETYFMLNTDFEIFFDLDLDADGKTVCQLDTQCMNTDSCGKKNTCRLSKTFDVANKYKNSLNEFVVDFVEVYSKMLHTGTYHHLPVKGGSCSMCSEPPTPPTCKQVKTMKDALLELFTPEGGDLQHAALRLGFHDCVGGCHGCLNINDDNNKGLSNVYSKINSLYDDLALADKHISRADFIALSAIVAVEIGVGLHSGSPVHKPCFEYLWGRKDCPTSPDGQGLLEFPQGWMTSQQMFSYFKRVFHFSAAETVTIMGSHTIGESKKGQAGFEGVWTPGEESVFNTTYYEAMVDPMLKWKNKNAGLRNGRQHWQWQAVDPVDGEEYFMLNTDFEIFFELDLDGDGQTMCILDNTCVQKKTCGIDGICPQAATYDQALSYAHSNNVFYKDYAVVFTKMLHTGNKELVAQGGTCESCFSK